MIELETGRVQPRPTHESTGSERVRRIVEVVDDMICQFLGDKAGIHELERSSWIVAFRYKSDIEKHMFRWQRPLCSKATAPFGRKLGNFDLGHFLSKHVFGLHCDCSWIVSQCAKD